MPFVGVTVNNTPLQVIFVIAVMAATGLIITVTVNGFPASPEDTGVTI